MKARIKTILDNNPPSIFATKVGLTFPICLGGRDYNGYGRDFHVEVEDTIWYCWEKQCAHLGGGEWEIIEEEEETDARTS